LHNIVNLLDHNFADLSFAVLNAAAISAFTAFIVMVRNSLVEIEAADVSHIFVGSDLVLSFYGIGLLIFLEILEKPPTFIDKDSIWIVWMGACAIFISSTPLLVLAIATERIAHQRKLINPLPLWSVNIISGVVPLVGATILAFNLRWLK
jgi:hypothetical protein